MHFQNIASEEDDELFYQQVMNDLNKLDKKANVLQKIADYFVELFEYLKEIFIIPK